MTMLLCAWRLGTRDMPKQGDKRSMRFREAAKQLGREAELRNRLLKGKHDMETRTLCAKVYNGLTPSVEEVQERILHLEGAVKTEEKFQKQETLSEWNSSIAAKAAEHLCLLGSLAIAPTPSRELPMLFTLIGQTSCLR